MNKEDFTRAVKLFEEHKHIIKLLDEINSRNYYNSTIKIINRVCDITIDDDAINKKAIEYMTKGGAGIGSLGVMILSHGDQ